MRTRTESLPGLTQIRIAGYGGQGIILTGMLLGKAASLFDGKHAVFTQSYGPEARGGASSADVVISDGPIDYPLVIEPDILVALFQEAYMRFRPQLKPGGTLILENDLVHPSAGDENASRIPATRMATELGKRIVTNVVVFGYTVGKTGVVSRDAAEKAIEATVKPKTIELNLRAFNAGFELATQEVAV
ncbi:MAG: 2-oxoacid:acceptor oxidoreductase family protein [Candidatus Hydrogenedentes bacterium]|nr:2-oxoacid:acceptor oxidoreductase family protein [Candidatus Hydrogenedentota bacterium]